MQLSLDKYTLNYVYLQQQTKKQKNKNLKTMTTSKNATHLADAVNGNVERELRELEEISKVGLYFREVTFNESGNPDSVGYYRAVVGFLDQRDAKKWSEMTNGEFALFFKKDGWDLLAYRGPAHITDIYQLAAGRCHVVYLNGNENYYELCEKIHGLSLTNYLKDVKDVLDIDDVFIKEMVNLYIQDYHLDSVKVDEKIKSNEDKFEYEYEDLREVAKKIYDTLIFLERFKGCEGYTVIDDVNWSIEGEYENEYPAYYEDYRDNKLYIFGVLYPADRVEEIRELI